jgi:superfamily II DNA or RNA helicase
VTRSAHDKSLIRIGDAVRVRRQSWRITDVRSHASCEVLTLAGSGTTNFGVERQVLTPFERVERIDFPARPRAVRPRRWRQLCRVLLADQGPVDRLQSAGRASIDLLAYQLEPALALVRGLGCRLLIADEVGLGKTIQAALAASELRARGAADRILVLAPAGLREQWKEELAGRFSIEAVVVDMREARRRSALAPLGTNPWRTAPTVIASIDYVKRPEVLAAVCACRWDVVVVDEAHGLTPRSDRYHAAAAICRLASYVLLLTATPHSGDPVAFESLCQLGSCAGERLLVFRRSRRDVGPDALRRIHQLRVRPSPAEQLMHRRLGELTAAVCSERGGCDRDTRLALCTLHKRALSSPWALERSVGQRLLTLSSVDREPAHQIELPFDDAGGELEVADIAPAWTCPGLRDFERERQMLVAISEAARSANLHDTKLHALTRLLGRLGAKREPAIVFTEYRDTLLHVRDRVPQACAVLHGGMTRDERRAALSDFGEGRRPVLLATDAAGEGLNLHHSCRVVINLELPWSPTRLEQRAGRVDRIGQRRTVHAFHLIAHDTGEARILEHLRARIARAKRDVATPDPLSSTSDDDERAAVRLVLDVDLPERVNTPSTAAIRPFDLSATWQVVAVPSTAEQMRLSFARHLWNHRDPHESSGCPLPASLTFARRWQTRSRLGANLLVLMHTTLEDGCGRCLASLVTPALASVATPLRRGLISSDLSRLWREIESRAKSVVPITTFEEEASHIHQAFWNAKLQREEAIATSLPRTSDPLQFGLFDRRLVRDHLARLEQEQAWRDDASRRVAEVQYAMTINIRPPRAVLVLAP